MDVRLLPGSGIHGTAGGYGERGGGRRSTRGNAVNSSIRVVQLLGRPERTQNPYTTLLVAALGDLVTVDYFDWRRALAGRYEILHLHWPEMLTRESLETGPTGRKTFDSRALRLFLSLLLLVRLRVTGTKLVQTVHNLRPHESGSWAERFVLSRVHRRTDAWIRLNTVSPLPTEARVYTIAHGHYRDLYGAPAQRPAVRQAYLYFGLVRAYKGIDELLECFAGTDGAQGRLRIVGEPRDDALGHRIAEAARLDQHLSARLEFLPADELADEIRASEVVVLPYPGMHNSGALLLALSLGRPVLVPSTPVNLEIQREVGPDWVITYGPDLTPAVLGLALARSRAGDREAQPDLSAREWPLIAAQTVAVYRELLGRR